MGTRKKGSELVFNLQWRHKIDSGGDKSNVIGMYDTPTTTSNFEMFKSYLLKNSGVAGNDVKVTYLTDNGQEWVIDSQESFDFALSAFRLKARFGEVIFLKLDKISSSKHNMLRKHSNDVETQSEVDSMGNNVVVPPEWFITYMKQFKRDIVDEVTYAVSSNLATNTKEKDKESIPIVIPSSKKGKPEPSKRSRKHLGHGETPIEKEHLILKTLKFERKLENKLDKLDAKTKKIKEKKQALINKIENDERYFGSKPLPVHVIDKGRCATVFVPKKEPVQSQIPVDDDGTPLLNGSARNLRTCQRMMGGEVYLHTWYITNTGKQKWTSKTELRLTWGSAELVPSVKIVRCPCLKPGEQGSISINFEVPKKPGTYESYWNFYHENVRFGSSLSCHIIVEEPLTPIMSPVSICPQPKVCANAAEPLNECLQPSIRKDVQDFFKNNKIDENSKPSEASQPELEDESLSFLEACLNADLTRLSQTKDNLKALENSPPSHPESVEAEEDQKPPKIMIYPEGLKDTSKAFSITVPVDTEKVIWYPPEFNHEFLKPLEIPVRQVIQPETKISPPPDAQILPNGITVWGNTKIQNTQNFSMMRVNPANLWCVTTIPSPSDVTEKQNDLNNGSVSTELPKYDQIQNVDMTGIESAVPTHAVMDLSKRMEDTKLGEQDSDSDWGSVCSFEKDMQMDAHLTTDFAENSSNKYGIHEKDLIVDLSTSKNSVGGEKDDKEEKINVITNEDNNNNNGSMENNNRSRGSISEAESEASSVSSGYDVLQVPVCEEKEDSSGYVYITIDGNKLPVPKHILRPDFLVNAEEAPGPISTDDERPLEKTSDTKENISEQASATGKSESPVSEAKQEIRDQTAQDNKPSITPAPGTPTGLPSDPFTGRLFIFPQNQPGYEVFNNTSNSTHSSLKRNDSFEPYAWSRSPTQYNLSDLGNMEGVNPMHLRSDPYGPLDNTSSPFVDYHTTSTPEQPTPTCPFASYGGSQYYQHHSSAQYPHVANYQQCGTRYQEKYQAPSAPPQPQQQQESPKSPEPTTGASGPVHHILPENFVSGAVNVASSALNTARSVINMLASPKPEAGRWVNGHWITENPESLRAKNLVILAEMGFWDTDLNATLLARHNDDIARVITELVQ